MRIIMKPSELGLNNLIFLVQKCTPMRTTLDLMLSLPRQLFARPNLGKEAKDRQQAATNSTPQRGTRLKLALKSTPKREPIATPIPK